MLERTLMVVFASYLLSGIMLAPVVILASAMHVRVRRSLIPKMIGWGAAALVFVAYISAAFD